MSALVDRLTVVHNESASRFEAEIEGRLAVVDYERRGDVLYFTHTGTPVPYRGQGVAGKVTAAALAYAREQGFQVVPICSFTSAFIRRNPQYQSLLKS
ncbi:MAG: N-acetyltransferase [Caldilineaceae bacterium]|nr:N-acetyltransferase [Caldilineaceae bacterium]